MRLLIVGMLRSELVTAAKIARDRGAQVAQVDGCEQALTHLRAGRGADLIFADVTGDIRGLIDSLRREHLNVPVVACGISTDRTVAVAAIHAGAREFVPLPPDPELIAAIIEAVSHDPDELIVRDPAMARVVELARQIARSDASVLITGETGVGKEVMARFLHARSRRAGRPFVSVNCAAIPEGLLESELFGHEKGAFTGAIARRVGKFEEASGGTLLLDEISEMDLKLQAKLLRALQERVIDRLGGGKPVPVDIRVLATSNRNLAETVRTGQFREDLYYRLNVVNLRIPPLRERPADILELAGHFIRRYAEAAGLPPRTLSSAAKRLLLASPWRGNVRELENALHRAVLLAGGPEIDAEAIVMPDGTAAYATDADPARRAAERAVVATRALVGRSVAEVEQTLILDTLDHCLGNRTHAARILGISIRTLRNKLNDYEAAGLLVPEPGSTRIVTA
ncbi:MAG TPA: sigma-54 dependent transcriptional regulator [Beijerinckiaceae bacterium]|nr:sigma-54 dependent transcriptional regulator [Beijerinckiaceae bacterium]